jgi:hypothetical protein
MLPRTFLVLTFLIGAAALSAHAQTPAPCTNYYQANIPVPAGYGAAYDIAVPSQLMITLDCAKANPTLDVGDGNANDYIYYQGYWYGGGTWYPYTFDASSGQLIGNAWYQKNATYTLGPNTNWSIWNYVVAYTCRWNGSTWKCGCADQACTTGYWQLQAYMRPQASTQSGGGSSTNSMTPPPPAAAVGYTVLDLNADETNWAQTVDFNNSGAAGKVAYLQPYNGGAQSATIDSQGRLNFSAGNGFQTRFGGSPHVGHAYQWGFYAEARVWLNPISDTANGWPSADICYSAEHFENGINNFDEFDGLELFSSGGVYYPSFQIHHYTNGVIDTTLGSFNDLSPALNGIDWTQPHTIGLLWVPTQHAPTSDGTGYFQFFIDNVGYNKYTYTASDPYAVAETLHQFLGVGASVVNTQQLEFFRVWIYPSYPAGGILQ